MKNHFKTILKSLTSRSLFFVAGVLLAVVASVTYAAVTFPLPVVNSGDVLYSGNWNDMVDDINNLNSRIGSLETRVYALENPSATCSCGTCGATRTINCNPPSGTCCNDTVQICTSAGWVVHALVSHCRAERTTPYLFSYVDNKYLVENDILGTFFQYGDMTVKDTESAYVNNNIGDTFKEKDIYHLNLEPTIEDNKYKLQIREIEPEESNIDKLELVKVIHKKGTVAFASDNSKGLADSIKVASFNQTKPTLCIDDLGQDCLQKLMTRDNNYIKKEEGSYIILKFKISKTTAASSYLNLTAWGSDFSPIIIPTPYSDGYSGKSLVIQLFKNGKWERMGNDLHTRALENNDEFRSLPPNLNDYVDSNGMLTMKIDWTFAHFVDSASVATTADYPFEQENLRLVKAEHSQYGDVASKLLKKDYDYASTVRGDTIDLEFSAGDKKLTANDTYDLFIISQGYYHGIRTYLHPYVDTSDSYKQELDGYIKELNEYLQKNTK